MRTLMDEHIKELETVAEPVQMLNIPIIVFQSTAGKSLRMLPVRQVKWRVSSPPVSRSLLCSQDGRSRTWTTMRLNNDF